MKFKQAKTGNYAVGRTGKVLYIVIHYTANDGDTAAGNANYFANNTVKASAHYFVDENEIWQSVKEADTAYHCGANKYKHKYCRNGNSIGIEMCSRRDATGRYYIKKETVNNTIALTKELMKKYNISQACVLRHYDVTGKNCPAPFVEDEKEWQSFCEKLDDAEPEKCYINIKLNGVLKRVEAIQDGGYNFVKLQDLRDSKISIEYDGMPIVSVNE